MPERVFKIGSLEAGMSARVVMANEAGTARTKELNARVSLTKRGLAERNRSSREARSTRAYRGECSGLV